MKVVDNFWEIHEKERALSKEHLAAASSSLNCAVGFHHTLTV